MVDSSVTVVFEDSVIGLEDIKKALGKEGFPVIGDPLVLK